MSDANEMPAGEAPQAASPAPKFVKTAGRFETVKLEWPIEYDGKTWDEVTVHRMSVAELASYMDRESKDVGLASLPMFDAPKEVIEAMDADDGARLDEVAARFLPRVFQAKAGSTPISGETTSPQQ